MSDIDKNILMKEYASKFSKFIYRLLKLTGFCRFDIINNRIVELTHTSMVYNAIVILIANCAVGYLLYSSILLGNYLKIPDALCLVHFALVANSILLNLTFVNRKSGLDLVENCIKVDCYIGVKETAFMRDEAVKKNLAFNCIIYALNLCNGIYLYQVYKVPMYLHIVGSMFFFWLFFAYNDFAFGLMLFSLNCARFRYLNVALMKIGEINELYVPSRSLFNTLFWNKKYDNFVTFPKKTGIEEFNRAYRMCFDMFAVLERHYCFPLLCGVLTVVVGSFVAVQTFIMRVKNPTGLDNGHTNVIVGWVILTWIFVIVMVTVIGMTSHQVQQTKLICSYIQLKPNKPAHIYKLAKTVLGTVNIRNSVPNIYNLFYLDSGFVMRIAASTLVYITVQLQLAFPRLPLSNVKLNETSHDYS